MSQMTMSATANLQVEVMYVSSAATDLQLEAKRKYQQNEVEV